MAITNFIPTVWSENLYRELDKQYIAVNNCNREFEGDIREKGNVVKICGLGSVRVSDYVKNANMGAPETLSDNVRELVIDQAKYFNFQIDDVDRAQSSPRLMELAMKNAASALANAADAHIFSLHKDATQRITRDDITKDNIVDTLIAARTKLFSKNVANADDIVVEVSPEIAELILKSKIELCTDNTAALENGCIGSIAGCKIFVSNNVVCEEDDNGIPVHKCFVRTKRSIAYAEQLSEIDAYRPELRFADAVKGLHLYGAKLVYTDELILLNLTIA